MISKFQVGFENLNTSAPPQPMNTKLPIQPMSTNLPIQPMNASNEQNNRHAKKDPPKWLTCPVSINGNTQIKVYDFKEGTLNNELSKVWCNVF